jgi:hypothetical protein
MNAFVHSGDFKLSTNTSLSPARAVWIRVFRLTNANAFMGWWKVLGYFQDWVQLPLSGIFFVLLLLWPLKYYLPFNDQYCCEIFQYSQSQNESFVPFSYPIIALIAVYFNFPLCVYTLLSPKGQHVLFDVILFSFHIPEETVCAHT